MSVRLLALALLAAAAGASAQPSPPVVFVHGIDSSGRTWAEVAAALRADGYGEPYAVHCDLNASGATDLASDVACSGLVPYDRFPDEGRVARRGGEPPALDTRHVYLNFRAVADDDSLTVHRDRDAPGRSNSNESGIVKQGAALGRAVRDVLAATGAERVVLVGHSMGGLAIREYLQRRAPDGRPAWWAEPDAPGGHRVAAAVTYGTPHLGSNINDLGTGVSASDPRSEAVRDVRFTYPRSTLGPGRYLYGGPEVETDAFYSFDVTADGDEDDLVVGLNAGDPAEEYGRDNPDLPLPRDVSYVWVVGDVRGLGGDGIVDADRQVLRRRGDDGVEVLVPEGLVRRVTTGRIHTEQTSDVETIRGVLGGLATSAGAAPRAEAAALRSAPNPAAVSATAEVVVAEPGPVRLALYDALGREVAVLAEGPRAAGPLRVGWRADALAPGAYLLVLDADGRRQSARVTVAR